MNLETWLEEQNVLTVGEEPNTCVKLLDAQESVWATWGVPVKSETVFAYFSGLRAQLATGRHAFTLVSYSGDEQRARFMHTVEGGSSAAKAAQTDEITRAKATAMNIDIADKQLQMMSVRLEAADARAAKMEERAGEMVELVWKLADRVEERDRTDRRTELEFEEKQARIEFLKEIGGQVAPLIGLVMPHLMQKFGKLFEPAPAPAQAPAPSLQATPEPADEGPRWPTAAEQQAEEEPPTEVVTPVAKKAARKAAPKKQLPSPAPKKARKRKPVA